MMQKNPYVGLNYFKKDQEEYFFGRENDIQIISDNLQTHRLTLFYGPSGVGKSSVLQAGVLNHLQKELEQDSFSEGNAIVYFNNWRNTPHHDLKRAFALETGHEPHADETLHAFIQRIDSAEPCQFYLILDQFEEYFLYHDDEDKNDPDSFAYQLAQLCNDYTLELNILISLREDGFAQLDYFQSSIPNLFDHYLRLRKLNRKAAKKAIEEPCKHYSQKMAHEVKLEPALVSKVLEEIDADKIAQQQGGVIPRKAPPNAEDKYEAEAPLLQLIMQRLWDKAHKEQGQLEGGQPITLSAESLESSGGTKGLIRQHLEQALDALDEADKRACARIFKILVTHSQAKIAHSAEDLAAEAGLALKDMQHLLADLAGDNRILRVISDEQGQQKFEIYHDTLASAIYEWRSEFDAKEEEMRLAAEKVKQQKQALKEQKLAEEAKDRTKQNKRQRRFLWLISVLTIITGGLAGASFRQQQHLRENKVQIEQQNIELRIASEEREQALERANEQRHRAIQQTKLTVATYLSVQAVQATETPSLTNGGADLGALLSVEVKNLLDEQNADGDKGDAIFKNRMRSIVALQPIERYLQGYSAYGSSLAYSLNSKYVFLSSGDNSLITSSAQTGERILFEGYTLEGYRKSVAYSPDGRYIASGSNDNKLVIWDAQTGEKIQEMQGDISYAYSLAYSPDNQYITAGSISGNIITWDTQTGEKIQELQENMGSVFGIAYSPDGKYIASGSNDNKLIIWNAQTGEKVQEMQGHTNSINSIAYSPDGKYIASGSSDNKLIICNAQTGEKVQEMQGHTDAINSITYSPDGKYIASGSSDNKLIIWNAQTGEKFQQLIGNTASISSIAYSPNGQHIISRSTNNNLIIWNVQIEQETRQFSGHESDIWSVAYSPDGKYIASGSRDNSLIIWNAETGEKIQQLTGHTGWIYSIAYSPDGKYIASGSRDNSLIIWDAKTGQMIQKLLGYKGTVWSIAYSPNGKYIATGNEDNSLIIWDAKTGEKVQQLTGDTGAIWSVAYAPDGKHIAASNGENNREDNLTIIWDVATGEKVQQLAGHRNIIWSIAYSPDGKYIASGSRGNSLIIWDAKTGEKIQQLAGHIGNIWSIAYSPNGKYIVSGSGDSNLIIWDVKTGGKTQQFSGYMGDVLSVVYSPDGKHIAFGSEDGSLIIWDDIRSYAEIACDKAGRNLTVAEWEYYIGDIMPYRKTCEQYDYPFDFADANQ